MKVKECKIGKKVLYRGHITTIKGIKLGKIKKQSPEIGNANAVFNTPREEKKFILANGGISKAKYLQPA